MVVLVGAAQRTLAWGVDGVGAGVEVLLQQRADESLGLAVHPRRVRRDGEVTDGLAREDRLEGHGVGVAEVVVAHELAEAHAQAGEVPQRAPEGPPGGPGAPAPQRLPGGTAAAGAGPGVLLER